MTREEALAILRKENGVVYSEYEEAVDVIEKTLADRPHGEWKKDGFFAICSECGHELQHYELVVSRLNFCPNCGADMREQL